MKQRPIIGDFTLCNDEWLGSLLLIGLCGKSNIEQLQVDQVVETVSDLLTEIIKPVFEKDAAKKVCNNYDRMWLIQMLD